MMNRKIQIIIIGIIVFLGLGLLGAYIWNRQVEPEDIPPEEKEAITSIATSTEKIEKSDPEEVVEEEPEIIEPEKKYIPEDVAIDDDFYQKAQTEKDQKYCEQIVEDFTRDNCFRALALGIPDVSICFRIKNEDKRAICKKEAAIREAATTKNPAQCVKFEDKFEQAECVGKLVEAGLTQDDCQKIPLQFYPRTLDNIEEIEPRDLCVNTVGLKQSLANSDLELCKTLWLRYQSVCLSKILNIPYDSDADNDGVGYGQEISFGTDPNNPDTDGDGYSDKAEIDGEYNPLGKGGYEDYILGTYYWMFK